MVKEEDELSAAKSSEAVWLICWLCAFLLNYFIIIISLYNLYDKYSISMG